MTTTPETTRGGGSSTAILTVILVSYFMILLDNSIIFTSLPTIHESMAFSVTDLSWVQDAYTLVFGGLLVNTFHQLGMALGLGILVTASAHAGTELPAAAALTARVGTALATGSVLLAGCLVAVLALIVPADLATRRRTAATRAGTPVASTAPAPQAVAAAPASSPIAC